MQITAKAAVFQQSGSAFAHRQAELLYRAMVS